MNILIAMYDSLRPDFLGCFGNEVVKTPNFDAFADEAFVFADTTAEYPITVPARTALVTGNYTFTNRNWSPLRDGEITLAQLIQAQGYRTAAFSDTPFQAGGGFGRGFDEFNWIPGGKCHAPIVDFYTPDISGISIAPGTAKSDVRFYMNTLINRAEYMKREGVYFPDIMTRHAFRWLDEHKDEQFMLWLDYFDPHEPWNPPEPYASMYDPGYTGRVFPMPHGPETDYLRPEELRHIRAQYAGCVTQVDEQFGKLCARLKELGLWDDTIVVLVSDHGEPLGEHGRMRKFEVPVYDDLTRTVFMVRVPGMSPGRANGLVQNVDFTPTLLSLLGIEPEHSMDGRDLTPLMRGEVSRVRDRAYSGAFQLRASIRTPEWKFIDNRGEKPDELFNLNQDPSEISNLAEREPRLASELHRELWEWGRNWAGVGCQRGIPWQGEDLTDMSRPVGGK